MNHFTVTTSAFVLISVLLTGTARGHEVQFKNNCAKDINVCTLENGEAKTKNCGDLPAGQDKKNDLPNGWAGRFWARYSDVGPLDGWPQADSLAEIKFDGAEGKDFYDISLVDGFGVGLKIQPLPGTFEKTTAESCQTIACQADIIGSCREELKLNKGGRVVACQSACTKFHTEEYCCTGSHNTPETCGPTDFSRFFKQACPQAYSYAFDDATSTFTCKSASGKPSGYKIEFC